MGHALYALADIMGAARAWRGLVPRERPLAYAAVTRKGWEAVLATNPGDADARVGLALVDLVSGIPRAVFERLRGLEDVEAAARLKAEAHVLLAASTGDAGLP